MLVCSRTSNEETQTWANGWTLIFLLTEEVWEDTAPSLFSLLFFILLRVSQTSACVRITWKAPSFRFTGFGERMIKERNQSPALETLGIVAGRRRRWWVGRHVRGIPRAVSGTGVAVWLPKLAGNIAVATQHRWGLLSCQRWSVTAGGSLFGIKYEALRAPICPLRWKVCLNFHLIPYYPGDR